MKKRHRQRLPFKHQYNKKQKNNNSNDNNNDSSENHNDNRKSQGKTKPIETSSNKTPDSVCRFFPFCFVWFQFGFCFVFVPPTETVNSPVVVSAL